MKRIHLAPTSLLRLTTATLLMPWLTPSGLAQSSNVGIVDDWTHHHVIFSDPGTRDEAIRNGQFQEWQRIVSHPRYRMQLLRQSLSLAGQTPTRFGLPRASEALSLDSNPRNEIANLRRQRSQESSLHADWGVPLGGDVAAGVYPAKYTLNVNAAPDCTNDFVVFPVNQAGHANNQANLVGVNNLYGMCPTGPVPTVLFAYFVGGGVIQTSPVISLDGTKVAFVESVNNASVFHVLTLDKRGNGGCPNSPCNGTAFGSPSVPGTNNSAVDIAIPISGGVSVTLSSPFVDYANDTAYVGDDSGNLHKFTAVFRGSPAETVLASQWPAIVISDVTLSPVVYDSASQNIFVGGSNGNLYCIRSSDGSFCGSTVVGAGANGGIIAGPIVDSTTERVFATANDFLNGAVLVQVDTSMGSRVEVTMGQPSHNRYNGAFDNAYFTDVGTGHMYFCGNATTSAIPTLWRVGFNNSGQMNPTNDGNNRPLASQAGGLGADACTPLTEIFNPSIGSDGLDLLFVGMAAHGAGNCGGSPCIMSFDITSGFPAGQKSTFTTTGNAGFGGIIVDDVSGGEPASNIYFGTLQSNHTGVQLSQSGLQ
jgi:hypothetical protein